jgi:hypothetical protein
MTAVSAAAVFQRKAHAVQYDRRRRRHPDRCEEFVAGALEASPGLRFKDKLQLALHFDHRRTSSYITVAEAATGGRKKGKGIRCRSSICDKSSGSDSSAGRFASSESWIDGTALRFPDEASKTCLHQYSTSCKKCLPEERWQYCVYLGAF